MNDRLPEAKRTDSLMHWRCFFLGCCLTSISVRLFYVVCFWVHLQVVKSNSLIQCKCHGLSGSCQTKTCWKVAPSLRKVASILRQKYREAILVRFIPQIVYGVNYFTKSKERLRNISERNRNLEWIRSGGSSKKIITSKQFWRLRLIKSPTWVTFSLKPILILLYF